MTIEDYYSILEQYQVSVSGMIYRMIHSREEARDLVQDAFINLWKNYEKLDNQRAALIYLYRTALHLAIDLLRRKKFTPASLDAESLSIREDQDADEVYQAIIKSTVYLKPKQKAVFILKDIEGFDFEEIAGLLDMPVSNLRSNLHLARKNIRELLKKHFQITLEYLYDL